MLTIFKKMFGSFAAGHIIKQNDFSMLQSYFLQKVKRDYLILFLNYIVIELFLGNSSSNGKVEKFSWNLSARGFKVFARLIQIQ